MFAVRVGLQKFNIEHKFEIASIITLYANWIKEGKLKVNSDWNKERQIKFTVQDPCQLVRKTFGDPMAEDLRYVTKAVVGEENFVDMTPNRSNNYCKTGCPRPAEPSVSSKQTRLNPPARPIVSPLAITATLRSMT
jgi:hypothetical protein